MKVSALLFSGLAALQAQRVLTTFAGTDWVFPGDGKPALNAPLGSNMAGIALDIDGSPIVVVNNDCIAGKVQKNGIFKVLAGNGFCGLTFLNSGDGGPATSAGIYSPGGAAVDKNGNLFILAGANVRKITPDGTISRFAGQPSVLGGFSGDNGPATKAQIAGSNGIAADSAGNVYIADSGNNRIRKVSLDGTITTIAGTGVQGYSGDGGAALSATLSFPNSLAFDPAGNLYFGENGHVRKISKDTSVITTVLNAYVNSLAFDASGNLYYGSGDAVYKAAPGASQGTLFAGGQAGYSGDGGPPLSAAFRGALYVAVDPSGTIYIAEQGNARVRKISNGIVTTIAGNGAYRYGGEGTPALTSPLSLPYGIAVDKEGSVYFSERNGHRVRKVKNGILATFAGNGNPGFSGDNGSAASAMINSPQGLAFDSAGNLYVADTGNGRIRKVTPTGSISTYATVDNPIAMVFDSGVLYVARSSCCVVQVDTAGKVTPFAGNGTRGNSGDGGPAINAMLDNPAGIARDAAGNIYVSDNNQGLIRKISAGGAISTFIPKGSVSFPSALTFDPSGNLLISDHLGSRIYKATPAGVVSILAGGGPNDQLGDGKIATSASIPVPNEMAFDAAGNLYINDEYNYRVRMIPASPPTIQAAPTSIGFSAASGGAPVSQAVTVTGSLTGLDFSVTLDSTAKWLSVDASAASTPRVLSLTADPSSLAPGSYTATVVLTPAASIPPSLSLSVTFSVGAAQPPQLATQQPNLSFTFSKGAPSASLPLQVLNAGGGSIAFTASVSGGGALVNAISISPSSGTVSPGKPVNLSVTANPSGLAVGTYTATIRVQGGVGGTILVPVVVTVSSLNQVLRLTQTGISFTAVVSGGVVPPQTFGVMNIGSGSLSWTVSTSTLAGGPDWLKIDTQSGSSTAGAVSPQITVGVDASSLSPGNYYGLVKVVSPTAANSPQVVTIALAVLAAGSDPGAMVQPQELVFNVPAGVVPGSQRVLVYNIGATPKTFSVGRPSGFGVLVLPHEGTLDPATPSSVVLQPTGGFPTGASTQVLNFQFSDGRVQSVRLTVISSSAAASSSARDAREATCTPTRLIPALTTLGGSFTVSAGWPVALSAKVTDDCLNAQISGSVSASFSNGDPPLALLPLNDGTWQATWASSHAVGNVVIRLDAVDSKQGISGSREVSGALNSDKDPPVFTQGSVGSAALPTPYQPLAPGAFVSIFGSKLADGFDSAKSLPLPNMLGNTLVLVAGQLAPLHFVTENQINFLVPYGVNASAPQQILIQRGLTYSQPIAMDMAPAQPGIFLLGGSAIVVAVRSDGTQSLVSSAAPAHAGDVLVIYCAGLGAVDSNVPAGSQTPLDRLSNAVAQVTVTIGGQNAPVSFAGLTPGSSGLYQVNAVVPAGITPADNVPIVLTVAGQTSRPAPIAVR